MYYPYFRGKLNELIVVRDQAELLAASNICPIIEPVKTSTNGLVRAFEAIAEAGGSATLVINPEHGEFKSRSDLVSEFFNSKLSEIEDIRVGILLDEDISLVDISKILRRHENLPITLIHAGFNKDAQSLLDLIEDGVELNHVFLDNKSSSRYRRRFMDHWRVLIRDGFEKMPNKSYPDVEFYSDLHLEYSESMNLNGFGDYLIVGDGYSDSGGPAWAVAIHLTFLDSDKEDEMHVFHFKSDRFDTPTDSPGKFAEALDKLVAEVNREGSMILKTSAVKEFLALHERKHFPGLGYVKKLAMQHHIETMAEYLTRLDD
jgi:hypothetical protein